MQVGQRSLLQVKVSDSLFRRKFFNSMQKVILLGMSLRIFGSSFQDLGRLERGNLEVKVMREGGQK